MRRFLIKLSYLVLPLWVFTVVLVAYYHYAVAPYATSELGRTGQLPLPIEYPDTVLDREYFTHVYDVKVLADTMVDVITIGDSFTTQNIRCFENFLAASGMSLANLMVMPNNPFQAAYNLLRQGIVDSTNVKTIVVETVERNVVKRLTTLNDASIEINTTDLDAIEANDEMGEATTTQSSLIDAKNYVLRRLGYKEVVGHLQLSRPFFSGEEPRGLYFYIKDVRTPSEIASDDATLMRKNVEKLNAAAAAAGVRIVYLVAPDKYDIYQNYIIDNPYKPKRVNEQLRAMFPSREQWVIGKEIVLPLVDAGEMDLYPRGDTHWGPRCSQLVAKELERSVRAGW